MWKEVNNSMRDTEELVHVGIKVPRSVKEKWEQAARAEDRSLSRWVLRQIEPLPQPTLFGKPISGVPGKTRRRA